MATLFYLVQISYTVLTSGTKVTVFVEQINKEYKLACKKKKKKDCHVLDGKKCNNYENQVAMINNEVNYCG